MSEGSFQSLDLTAARVGFDRLFEQVLRGTGRIEITRDGASVEAAADDETCVLISMAELRGLERALEILSSTENAREMRNDVLRLADELSQTRQPVAAATAGGA